MTVVKNNSDGLSEVEYHIFKTIENIRDTTTKEKSVDWITKSIKTKVGEIGYSNKYKVSSSIHDGEWLYDLVWFQKNDEGFLEKVILALESELSNRNFSALRYDFEKLLISNAEYKVMICFGSGNFNYPQNVNGLLEMFDKSVQLNKNISPQSRILVLVWEDYMTGDIYPHLIIKN